MIQLLDSLIYMVLRYIIRGFYIDTQKETKNKYEEFVYCI